MDKNEMIALLTTNFHKWNVYREKSNYKYIDLRNANLYNVDLRNADLRNANLNWQSHTLIAEILRQAANENVQWRMVAGLVAVSLDWCWKEFKEKLTPEQWEWGVSVLKQWKNYPSILDTEE